MDKKLGRLLQPSVGFFLWVLLAFSVAAGLAQNYLLAGIFLAVTALSFVLYLAWRNQRRSQLQKYLASQLDPDEHAGGARIPLPMVTVRLHDGAVVYANDAFVRLVQFQDTMLEKLLPEVLPGFALDWLVGGKQEYPRQVIIGERRYRAYGTVIPTEDPDGTRLGVVYFADLTDLYLVHDEYIRSRPVVSIILVDNYEELTKNLSEAAISTLNARINEVITKWTEDYHGLLRRLERNRYLFVMETKDLERATAARFSLLEDIHEITNAAGLAVSLSIGVGTGGENFEEAYQFAALAVDTCLSRGGDQAVIKKRVDFEFYGGRTRETERHSKVGSRLTATSLSALISQSSQVFVMGHSHADLDSLGAAVGVCCLCRKLGKPYHIVMDLQNNAAQTLVEELQRVPQYADAIISGQEAMLRCDNRSTLVVVDTNRPEQVECPPLLESIHKTCLIDHHRRANSYFEATISLHEPYASSAAELVTEVLEYALESKDMLRVEAVSLMAGIMLDTKSFYVRTGERTFEAASYLRQLGADPVEVKKLLQLDLEETKKKFAILEAARVCHKDVAMVLLDTTISRPLAGQAADELVNTTDFTASFVVYPDKDTVMISARSIGQVNVQMILEPLGGGGNAATAGAQIRGSTVTEVAVKLRQAIDEYYQQ